MLPMSPNFCLWLPGNTFSFENALFGILGGDAIGYFLFLPHARSINLFMRKILHCRRSLYVDFLFRNATSNVRGKGRPCSLLSLFRWPHLTFMTPTPCSTTMTLSLRDTSRTKSRKVRQPLSIPYVSTLAAIQSVIYLFECVGQRGINVLLTLCSWNVFCIVDNYFSCYVYKKYILIQHDMCL